MSNRLKYGVVLLFVLFAAGLIWLLGRGNSSTNTQNKGVAYNYISSDWTKKYEWDSKDPYGLFLFKEKVLKQLKNQKKLYSINTVAEFKLQLGKNQKATYLFVGDELGMIDAEVDSIFRQVDILGSDLFVVASKMTEHFIEPYELSFDYAPKVEVQSLYSDFPFIYLYQNDTIAHEWSVFTSFKDEDIPTRVLSNLNSYPNFLEVKWGAGKAYINTTPEGVQNFQVNRPEAIAYAHEIVKHIDPKKPLYLLEFARMKERDPFDQFNNQSQNTGKKDNSYLQLLLKTPALRAALLLTFLGLFLFIVFRSKRMRPLIPGVPEKRNMSKIFVQTMASIYHTKNNPSTVLKLHKRNFYDTVQKHFFIDLSKRSGETEIKSLAEKSGYPLPKLEKLIAQLEAVRNVDDVLLNNCTASKREFYELSGIISEKVQLRIDQQKIELYKSIWLIFPLLLIGFFIAFFGIYLMVKASSIGVLLLILGAVVMLICIRLLSIPVLRFEKDQWHVFPLLGAKKKFTTQEIEKVEKTNSGFLIHLSSGQKVALQLQNVEEHKLRILSNYLHKLFNVEL
ncbi:MAG: hypothetical protein V4638_00280 [Bacteroidota bacterium]